ncbi:MAG: amino acid permease [Planctomycetes bacterium]|nr:amino acid permease [Planctomycetota bacterium]
MAKLQRQLGFLGVFSVGVGAMISSGLFILPALAYSKAGSGIIVSYLLASILILPSVLSKAELTTAMPKAGGTYFFIERSLGSTWGLFSGFAGWFSLALKSAFAVVGMAIIVSVLLKSISGIELYEHHLKIIAIVCCLGFTLLNIISVKQTGRLQIFLVGILLAILVVFSGLGIGSVESFRYEGLLSNGWGVIFATSGLVFISFGGLTKIASIAEEVKNPSRNLPLGMILAWLVVTLLYISVVTITVGVLSSDELSASYMPISLAASKFMGSWGFWILSIAAIAAFLTTANGGILTASRSPMAMSRDRLLPSVFARVNKKFGTPHISVLITGVFMVGAIVFLDLETLVKTASTIMIILFMLANASVIIMRESRIQSYRPKFKSPLYPYMHIFAIVAYALLIIDMGKVPLLITAGFFVFSIAWFFIYVYNRGDRASAIMHIVERVTAKELQTVTLENELRDILIERDEIIEDRFDKLIKNCEILDIKGSKTAEEVFRQASVILEKRLDTSEYVLFEKFIHREGEGGTVVQPGFAIPHIIVEGTNKFDILLVRAVDGIKFPHTKEPVKIMFALAGSQDERNYHLRALMAIAQISQEKNFEHRWMTARDSESIRNLILLSTRPRDTKF